MEQANARFACKEEPARLLPPSGQVAGLHVVDHGPQTIHLATLYDFQRFQPAECGVGCP